MTSWIWLSSLLSLSGLVFLVISGPRTPSRVSYSLSTCLYAVSSIAALLGLIGVLFSHGETETYLFSLFGLQHYEGFRVGLATSIITLILYVLCALWMGWRWRAASAADVTEVAHDEALLMAWVTFGLSILILAPSLGQAFVGVAIAVLGAIYVVWRATLREGVRALEVRVVGSVALAIATILQTLPTWVAWHVLHTVQLSEIHYQVTSASWHGPMWLIWVWFIGSLLAIATVALAPRFVQPRPWASTTGMPLRIAAILGLSGGFYVWLVWPVVIASSWQIAIVAVAGLLMLGAVVMAFRRSQAVL
ncbi:MULTISPECIES: hypothetical protein [Alicyclobacillus]|uniref:Uncharacterized protein n=1 Tax=Alicyclobacillus acidoterrestris (strain ATCC 49025 / DSM 3922 / CIP 106132 / NCIMB 13137 / GD3B) TaxID=1356854 RepID=T0BNG6_ALIAG|nr:MULTISPECIES: hypothetical protein [Alicyclobacillus]EPZ45548.1 hypothetical protein N007_08885 [Alicyclobacillus acidoterrestris ATCC 49025]UNO49515.1 hypothetical protein K1I37_02900 [Alicyclobacillus acidoterrestris]